SGAFHHLLVYLDDGVNSEGQNYLKMRERLVAYFDRKNCGMPDELADETLNRVARRLEEDGSIQSETAAREWYTVGGFVFQEYLRKSDRATQAHEEIWRESRAVTNQPNEAGEVKEQMLSCLERCTDKLEQVNRGIILQYYIGKERIKIENRRALAAKLGITPNALSIRACRIREKLEACVKECVSTR